ncbi:reprolysin-like metallopeptidase [Clavibacter michiganensis]|uniref:Peptidase M11 gametolysin domain-containing protein n=1 Tax=Clavibacter michiganensis subsp. insidiosus TaxID=33014 RepID=A0A0D5CND4_9MICO|nr:hypothetical protein [Clavibacter michiganensis]AJW80750.1 hypothetical protein VO01_16085 [Clavibacter michiganensis subsp. insidiosus]AWF99953.1 hypothetical protein BEH61_15715 [Clavibacter michiganensis subsp. insidiosus]RIJ45049.1 hypothetical protein DZF93_00470 [Clavibacter michiganensis subsp. insidiosus]
MRPPSLLPILSLPAALVVGALLPASSAGAAGAGGYTVQPATPRGHGVIQQVTAVMVAPAGIDRNFTRGDVVAALQEDDAFYDAETGGTVRLAAESVTDWIEPDDPSVSCKDYASINRFAQQYSGWTPGPDKHLLAIVPDGTQCAYTNNSEQTDSVDAGGVSFVSSANPDIIAHELGHSFSLHHQSSVQCTSGWDFDAADGLPSDCVRLEYGNTTDVMGSAYTFYPLSASTLDRMGVVSHRAVPTCGGSRRIPIRTLSAGYGAQRVVSWADPQEPSVVYYVQYRDEVDQSEYDYLWDSPFKVDRGSGVQIIRSDPQGAAGGSTLVRPGDDSPSAELVRAGETVPLIHGMSVSVAAIDEVAHVATVDVTVPCGAGGRTVSPRADQDALSDSSSTEQAGEMTEMTGMGQLAAMPGMPPMTEASLGRDPSDVTDVLRGVR